MTAERINAAAHAGMVASRPAVCAEKLADLFRDEEFGSALETLAAKLFPDEDGADRTALRSALKTWLPLTLPGAGMNLPGHAGLVQSLMQRGWKIIPARLPGGPPPRLADLWVAADHEGNVTDTGWVGKVSTDGKWFNTPVTAEARGVRMEVDGIADQGQVEGQGAYQAPVAYFLRAPAGGCKSCGDPSSTPRMRVPAMGGKGEANGAATVRSY